MKLTTRLFKMVILNFSLSFTVFSQSTTLTLQPDPDNGKDALISSLYPDNNYGDHTTFRGRAWTNSGEEGISRGLIFFDLSDIPEGSEILSATLSLTPYVTGSTDPLHGENAVTLSRIIENWESDEVTWNTQPETDELYRVSIGESSEAITYESIDVKDLIIDQYNNPTQNYGMLLKLDLESPYQAASFASSNHDNVEMRPKLRIDYLPPLSDINDSEKQNQMSDFVIHPNPSNSGVFTIETDVMNGSRLVEIMNLAGQLIVRQQMESNALEIDLSNYPKGLYHIRVSDTYQTEVYKVIYQ